MLNILAEQNYQFHDSSSRELIYEQDLDDLRRNWRKMQHEYRQKHQQLTEEDVQYGKGEFEAMTQRVALLTNRTMDEVFQDICNWVDS